MCHHRNLLMIIDFAVGWENSGKYANETTTNSYYMYIYKKLS